MLPTLTRRTMIALATAGSAALLGGAFAFQFLGGLHPCHLCLLQRWPHAAAIVIGLAALALRMPRLAWAGAAAALVTAGIGLQHTGVERGWWAGPDTCTSGDVGAMSSDQLFDRIMNAPVIRCDEVAWTLAGLSMASWNAILSVLLALIWVTAARRRAGV